MRHIVGRHAPYSHKCVEGEFSEVDRALRVPPCGGLLFLRIMGAHVEERTTHCPRCAEPATRIVRGIPEIRSTFRISSVLASITNSVAFEESSEWGCRSCGHESGTKTNLVS